MLCRCDLADDDELADYIRFSADQVDWEQFLKLVSFNTMGGLVHYRLKRMARPMWPKFLSDYLADRHRHYNLVQLAQVSETARLVTLLSRAGIPSIVLKGVAVAHLLYEPNSGLRYSSDIDLMVAQEAFRHADQLLVDHGYRRQWPNGQIPESGSDMLFHLLHALTYVHRETGLVLELHHRLTPNPFCLRSTFAESLAKSVEIALPGATIRTLDGALLIGYLAWHALGHLECRVKWFSDLTRALLRAEESTLSTLLADCEEIGAGSALRLASGVANILYQNELRKRPFCSDYRSCASPEPLACDVKKILGALNQAKAYAVRRTLSRIPAELSFLRLNKRLCQSTRARRYAVIREFTDPRDVLTLGLDRRWQGLYAMAGPVLAAGRYLRRLSVKQN